MTRIHRLTAGASTLFAIVVFATPAAGQARAPQPTTTAAGRADVTLRVPVQLQSFDPATTQAKISCTAGFIGNPSENRVQANKDTTINLTNGAFSGTVPLKLTLSVAQPGEQWRYSCNFRLFNSQLNSWDPTMTEAWAKPRSGTTPTRVVEATFTVP